jgi:mannose-6-phosphate isomerase-like protein (cupin superfamily)
MTTQNVEAKDASFAVLENGESLQTAVMRLAPGEESGPLGNEHGASEQVLFVFAGEVEAEVGGRKFTMRAGDSTIVPKDAPHRFVNRYTEPAITFNVYAPPAY